MNKTKLSFLAGLLLSSAVFAAPYTITDLGGSFERASFANAINNNGLVIGTFEGSINALGIPEFGSHAFSFDGTFFIDLGTLSPDSTTLSSNGLGVNDFGQMIGFSHVNTSIVDGEFLLGIQGFVSENGVMTSLGLPGSIEANYSSAIDINNAGMIAGFAGTQVNLSNPTSLFESLQAVVIDPTASPEKFTLLGSLVDPASELTGRSVARSINESGQITGWSETELDGVINSIHTFYIDPLGSNLIIDAGTLGGTSSSPKDINNAGVIVGRSQLDDATELKNATTSAFKFDIVNDISMVNLGTLTEDFPGSLANAINENNQIVGNSISGPIADTSLPIFPTHAVLFENNAVIDLNLQIDCALGWTLIVATDINDSGQIVGSGLINGATHGFLLTPNVNGGAAQSCEDPSTGSSSGGSIEFEFLLLLLLASFLKSRFN